MFKFNLLKVLVLPAIFILSLSSDAAELKKFGTDITIVGVITDGQEAYFYKQLSEFVKPDTNVVRIFIASRGGYLDTGLRIMNVIRRIRLSGIRVECFTPFAGSAAFSIFQMCSERFVFQNTFMLEHRAINPQTKRCDWLCMKLDEIRLTPEADRFGLTYQQWWEMLDGDMIAKSGKHAKSLKWADKIINLEFNRNTKVYKR